MKNSSGLQMLPITGGAETYIKSKAGYSRNNLSVKKKKGQENNDVFAKNPWNFHGCSWLGGI